MVHYQGIGRFARLSPLQVSVLFGFNSGTNVAAYEAEEKPRAKVINAMEVKVLLFLLSFESGDGLDGLLLVLRHHVGQKIRIMSFCDPESHQGRRCSTLNSSCNNRSAQPPIFVMRAPLCQPLSRPRPALSKHRVYIISKSDRVRRPCWVSPVGRPCKSPSYRASTRPQQHTVHNGKSCVELQVTTRHSITRV
jgi:hypothetical protein